MPNLKYESFYTDINLPKEVMIYGIYNDWEGFRIILKSLDYSECSGIIRISFDLAILSYRVIEEGDYLKTPGSDVGWISIIRNSDYLDWFYKESCGVYNDQNLIHYSIQTFGLCVDVINSIIPSIEWL